MERFTLIHACFSWHLYFEIFIIPWGIERKTISLKKIINNNCLMKYLKFQSIHCACAVATFQNQIIFVRIKITSLWNYLLSENKCSVFQNWWKSRVGFGICTTGGVRNRLDVSTCLSLIDWFRISCDWLLSHFVMVPLTQQVLSNGELVQPPPWYNHREMTCIYTINS